MLKLLGGTFESKDPSGFIPGRKTIKRIVKYLDKLSTDSPVLTQLDEFYQSSRYFGVSRKAFPKVPAASQPSYLVDKYVKDITTTRFGGKYTLRRHPKEVANALGKLVDENRLTEAGKNSVIEYYARTGDPDKILPLVSALQAPQTLHFNHWLYSLYNQRRWKPRNFQIKSALPILAAMSDSQLPANAQTWNMVLMAMSTHYGMGTIYQEMHNRNIPLDKEGANVLATALCSVNGVDTVAEILKQEPAMITRPMLHGVLKCMLTTCQKDNANVQQAFDYLNYWAARGIKPNQTTLNVFLEQFSYRHHLDWMVGISEFFEAEYGVSMTSQSWAHMMYAVARINENPTKYKMLGMIMAEANKLALTSGVRSAMQLWFKLAEENSQTITYPGSHVWNYLRHELNWQKWSGPPDYKINKDAARAAATMGFSDEQPLFPLKDIDLSEYKIHTEKRWYNRPKAFKESPTGKEN